jgi:hypothetical protein
VLDEQARCRLDHPQPHGADVSQTAGVVVAPLDSCGQGAPVHLGAESLQRCSGRIRTGKADDHVPGSEQLRDNGGPDVAGRSGDEYLHGNTSCKAVAPMQLGVWGVLIQ